MSQTKEYTKEQKLQIIQYVMSDKKLKFWCKVKVKNPEYCDTSTILYYWWWVPSVGLSLYSLLPSWQQSFNVIIPRYKQYDKEIEILWHDVYLHHILQWAKDNDIKKKVDVCPNCKIEFDSKWDCPECWLWIDNFVLKKERHILSIVLSQRDYKKDLYWQSEETIDKLFSLIQESEYKDFISQTIR
jgi:hypothetical protein